MAQKPDMQRGKGKGAPSAKPLAKGFVQAGGLLGTKVRSAAGKRGFAETRLLTQWAEIAGAATAAITRPVSVGYGAGGIGATLTLLADGAHAPELQLQLPAIRARVNACYGYNAISRIKLTQTAVTGFGEAVADYAPPEPAALRNPELIETLEKITDSGLRAALNRLGQHVQARQPETHAGKRTHR